MFHAVLLTRYGRCFYDMSVLLIYMVEDRSPRTERTVREEVLIVLVVEERLQYALQCGLFGSDVSNHGNPVVSTMASACLFSNM